MLVNVVKEPNMLYETLSMVSNRYDGKSYTETAKRLISRFGSVLSQKQISTLKINADLADQVSGVVCGTFKPNKRAEFEFFFEPFDKEHPNRVNNVARLLFLSLSGLGNSDFDSSVEETKQRWRRVKEGKLGLLNISSNGIQLESASSELEKTLFENIYQMDCDVEVKMNAFRAIDRSDNFIDRLADLLRPYCRSLERHMPKLKPYYTLLADRWEYNFKIIHPQVFSQLTRIDPKILESMPLNAVVSLFYFNEVWWGYEDAFENDTQSEMINVCLGVAVHSEFVSGATETRSDNVGLIMQLLSNPVNTSILEILSKGKDYISSVAQKLNMNASVVSRHLQALHEAKLVNRERLNRRIYYELDLAAVDAALSGYKSILSKPND